MDIERSFTCRPGMGDSVTGFALSASDDFSARYDLDRIQGVFSRPAHSLYGRSYVGTVLVLNTAKGGVASSWMLKNMVDKGMAPAALVLNTANPIMAQGAAFANLPLVHLFDVDITAAISSGDLVTVDPAAGMVVKHRQSDRDGEPQRR